MMKLLLIVLLISFKAFALNESLILMPANKSYIQYIVPKYLDWHKKHFSFPHDSPLLKKLSRHLDRWQLPDSQHRELSFKYASEDNKARYSLRVFVHPEIRKTEGLSGPGFPPGKEAWFAEWHDNGKFCLVTSEAVEHFSVWCRLPREKKFHLSHEEITIKELPAGWPVSFPWTTPEMIAVRMNGKINEIIFSGSNTHPAMTPTALLPVVNLHTKETHIPLDRVGVTGDGEIRIFYP